MHRRSAHPQRPDAELLLAAYAQGIFPMAIGPRRSIKWLSPDPRGVLPLESFRVPRSLAKVLRQERFEITVDRATPEVVAACAGSRGGDNGSWMTQALLDGYLDLHRAGHVHSVEAWRGGQLVGGLYGVRLRGLFAGESMFVRPDSGGSDASKVCLVRLVEILREGGFVLLDTQMVTEHIRRFGGIEIPAEEYLARLERALNVDARWPAPPA